MSTSADFLASIVARPSLDEPRLAYASWLTKQKNPRGEFIRVQVALAQPDGGGADREKLLKREQTLLKKHADEWSGELPKWARESAPGFVRGFPEVRCDASNWLSGGAELAKQFPLHRVNMKATAKTLPQLAKSAALRQVELLDLSHSPLDDASVAAFVTSPNLGELSALYLWRCGLGAGAARAIAESPHLANLRKLQLEENRLTVDGVAALAGSPHLRRLVSLTLRSNHTGPGAGVALAGSPILDPLTSLNLGNNDLGADDCVHFLAQAPAGLRRLDLEGNAPGDAGAEALAAARQLDRLASLDVSYDQLSARGALALSQAKHLSSLTTLWIGANKLGAEGIKALAGSAVFANLEELNLDAADVGDDGVLAIVASTHLTRLRTLGLWDAQVGTTGAKALAAAASLENLERLSLFGNPFAKECRALLRERFGKRVSM